MNRKAVFIGMFLGALGALPLVHAGDSRANGMISMTFHDGNVDRTKSKHFYVVIEDGLVHWQNFREKDKAEMKDPKNVYELRASEVPSKVAKNAVEQNDDLASAKTDPE